MKTQQEMRELLLDVMDADEQSEYADLLILNKFYSMINEIIDIEPRRNKGYYFAKDSGKFRVVLGRAKDRKFYGSYETEAEAINKVAEVKGEKYDGKEPVYNTRTGSNYITHLAGFDLTAFDFDSVEE